MSIHFYGIRHHGPGSARNLLQALQEQSPDCILLEHPADTDAALQQAATPGLVPPVALLVFDPKVFSRAAYYPFARFSPEWQALQFAADRQIPVLPMDLPAGIQFLTDQEASTEIQGLNPSTDSEERYIEHDPLGHLAYLAGYKDSERWWEAVLEKSAAGSGIFVALQEMMHTLRNTLQRRESPETLLREAFMRKTIREALDSGYRNVAVISGAWHTPALEQWNSIKASQDKALLRGRKKTTVQATWIPWTYERLASESGYAAGVLSPAWYELLFDHPHESTHRWMVKAARLMREEDIDISTAHVMEAVRLADVLAALRRRNVAGIEDMEQAALSVYFQGHGDAFQLIRRRLIIGETIGSIPDSLPAAPLQRDLEQEIRSVRLSKEYTSLDEILKDLDLRNDTQLRASRLLHRLNLLEVPWGAPIEKQGNAISTFRESWRLKWLPDYALRLIQAGMWGNTVESAALHCVLDRCRHSSELPVLAGLAAEALRAELTQAVSALIQKLEASAALAKDVHLLMDTLPGLVRIVRYGNVRQTDAAAVRHLLQQFIPRIALGLPAACMQLDEDPADELFQKVRETNRHILLLDEEAFAQYWQQALAQVMRASGVHPLLQGCATRILFDRSALSNEEADQQFSLALSTGNEPIYSARWIEGFLAGSGLLLIHYPPLWKLLDAWVSGLVEQAFHHTLPLLRRTFSAFSGPERQKMLSLAIRHTQESPPTDTGDWDTERAEIIAPTLQLLLGASPTPEN